MAPVGRIHIQGDDVAGRATITGGAFKDDESRQLAVGLFGDPTGAFGMGEEVLSSALE